jgi:hypothetical protein
MQTPKSNKIVQQWVDSDYAIDLKVSATKEGMSILEYTRKLAKRKFNDKGKDETFKFGL